MGEFVVDLLDFARSVGTFHDRARQISASYFAESRAEEDSSRSPSTLIERVSKRLRTSKSADEHTCGTDPTTMTGTAAPSTTLLTLRVPRPFNNVSEALFWCIGSGKHFLSVACPASSQPRGDSRRVVDCVAFESYERGRFIVITVLECTAIGTTTTTTASSTNVGPNSSRVRLQISVSRPEMMPHVREAFLRRCTIAVAAPRAVSTATTKPKPLRSTVERSGNLSQDRSADVLRIEEALSEAYALRKRSESDRSFSPRLIALKALEVRNLLVSTYTKTRGGRAE